MGKSRRLQLHSILQTILGSDHVYFQPPESVKLVYPCIVYERLRANTKYANNMPYAYFQGYEVTFISKDPDAPTIDALAMGIPYVQYNRHFNSDNLNHDVYILYY